MRIDQPVPGSQLKLVERADPREVRRVDAADAEVARGERHPEDFDAMPLTANTRMISPNASVTIAM